MADRSLSQVVPSCDSDKTPRHAVENGGFGVQGEGMFEMRVGLSQPDYRVRLQIGSCCGGQEPSW